MGTLVVPPWLLSDRVLSSRRQSPSLTVNCRSACSPAEDEWEEMERVITGGGKPGVRSRLLTARSRRLLGRLYETSSWVRHQ